jgi:hypothetical protein
VRYLCDPADDGERQRYDGPDQMQGSADCDPDQPEGQQDKPDDRVEHQRPAQHEQDAPQEESDHLTAQYVANRQKFRLLYGIRRMERAADQWTAFHMPKAHLVAPALQFREFLYRDVADDRQVFGRRP